MKSINYRVTKRTVIKGLIVLMGVFSLSSCLKNGPYDYNFSGVGASVDLPLAASNSNGVVPFTFAVGSNTFPVYANLASPSPLSSATTVTLIVDTAYFNSFNAANGNAYVLLPDSTYTLGSLNLSIPAGQRLDSCEVTFNINMLNEIGADSIAYVLPFSISSASEPIEQWSHLLIGVSTP